MIRTREAQPIPIRVEVSALLDAERLDAADIEAHATRGGRDLFEQQRHFVAFRYELAHHLQVLCERLGLGPKLSDRALCELRLGLLIRIVDPRDALFEHVEFDHAGVILHVPEEARRREAKDGEEHHHLLTLGARNEIHHRLPHRDGERHGPDRG